MPKANETAAAKGTNNRRKAASAGRKLSRERRRWERLPLPIPIFARGVDEQGKEFLEFTTTLNISAGGALLAMRRYLRPSSKVLLEIPAAPLPRFSKLPQFVRNLEAEVIRVNSSEPAYLSALRFERQIA